jgi:hypothetical protein
MIVGQGPLNDTRPVGRDMVAWPGRGGGWLLGSLFNKKPISILHGPLRRI